MRNQRELFERLNKKVEIIYGKTFDGFKVDFMKTRNGRDNYGDPTISPVLGGSACWFWGGIQLSFDGDIIKFALRWEQELDKKLAEKMAALQEILL